MSLLRAVQKGIKAQVDAASLGIELYDGVPSSASFPHAEFGSVFFVPDDADLVSGRELTIQIDVWGRDQGKLHPTQVYVDGLYGALHEVSLTLDDPYAGVTCRVTLTRTIMDPDGITAHGILQVTVLAEDTT